MAPAERQTFIDRMLPRGTTDLFFFDGEHIRNMAESGREGMHIKSSLDALLGLDAVVRLATGTSGCMYYEVQAPTAPVPLRRSRPRRQKRG